MKINKIKKFINLACIGLLSSVIMDTFLWFTHKYYIPCWTIGVISLSVIMLLQVLKGELKE